MFCTVPMTDSHVKKLEVTGMKMCSRHILWETEHHREVQQSNTAQSDVDVYVKRTIKNTSEDKHWRRYHLGEEEEKTGAEMDWLYQSRHESYPDNQRWSLWQNNNY